MTTCTPEELSALMLPGTIPELISECSRVWRPDVAGHDRYGTVHRIAGSQASVAFDGLELVVKVPLRTLQLVLHHKTGRSHAAWWMEACGWDHIIWQLEHDREALWQDCAFLLANLDPDDLRTLPDLSSWVDAEAIRLMVLHLADLAQP